MKTLVVYFSRKGRVRRVAERLAAERGADLLELKTTERTEGILGFWWCGRFGMHRWGMPLVPTDIHPAAYDRVVLCTPVWVFDICAPMREFVRQTAACLPQTELVLVHFNPLTPYRRAARRLSAALGQPPVRVVSLACPWGIEMFRREIGG